MRRLVALLLGVIAVIWLSGTPARAGTLADCLAKHHVCVTSHGRALISQSQQDQLERQIGNDDIYLVVAASGAAGYNAAMRQIIRTLDAQKQQFVVGFLDSGRKHFGAANRGMLAAGAAADIATSVVQQHQSDRDIFAAMQDFVRQVQQEAQAPGSPAAASSPPSHTARNVLIVLGVIVLLVLLGGLFIWRPRRQRRQRELAEAKAAAQEDLLALNNRITDHQNDVSVQGNPEAAAEQAAALAAYERGTAALDAARKPRDMQAVSRNIAEGQYRLASAEALANGQPKPGRRPMCFFDPRHGMSVADVSWAPPDGGPSRMVPVCIDDGGAMLGGFLLGDALASPPVIINEYGYGDPGYYGGGDNFGGGDFGGGGNDYGGGDFGGGDYGGGDFGGGDYGGGDFGGGDFGGGDNSVGGGDF